MDEKEVRVFDREGAPLLTIMRAPVKSRARMLNKLESAEDHRDKPLPRPKFNGSSCRPRSRSHKSLGRSCRPRSFRDVGDCLGIPLIYFGTSRLAVVLLRVEQGGHGATRTHHVV